MPELPEVETVRRQLEPLVRGRTVVRAVVRWPKLVRPPGRASLARRIRGLTFRAVRRHGKYLLFDLSNDLSNDHVLVSHLGMTGNYRLFGRDEPRPPHTIALFALDDGRDLAYIDPRRFGRMRLVAAGAAPSSPELDGIGPDPLAPGFTPARLAMILAGTRRMIRECLLDQRRIAGLGNIYVAEVLFRAGVHPNETSRGLDSERVARLHREIRGVLTAAIRSKGSTIHSYRDSEGNRGGFAERLAVYGREGEPCIRCGRPIYREVRSGRSSFFCPSCQPKPRAPRRRAGAGARRTAR